MKGKVYFAVGAAAGLLTGSRMGRGLYDRVSRTAGKVAGNETVRNGVSSASEHAIDAAKSAGDGVSHKITELRKHTAEKHAAENAADAYRDAAAGGEADGRSSARLMGRLHSHHRSTTAAVNGTLAPPE